MAISDSSKVDLLYKKLFGVAKTDTSTNKGASNESIASSALNRGDKIWLNASNITQTPPVANTSVVQLYQNSNAVKCVADSTTVPIGSVYPTWKTNLTDWITPEFGSNYFIKVYADGSDAANAVSTGTQLFDSGSAGVGEWFFDYQAGVLNFIGGTIPAALTSTKAIYITGYRYVGLIGIDNINSSLAQAAFDEANTALNNAASSSLYANTALNNAASASLYANTAIRNAASSSLYANAGITLAQAAYNQGNSTAVYANTAINNAASASTYANTGITLAQASFNVANNALANTNYIVTAQDLAVSSNLYVTSTIVTGSGSGGNIIGANTITANSFVGKIDAGVF